MPVLVSRTQTLTFTPPSSLCWLFSHSCHPAAKRQPPSSYSTQREQTRCVGEWGRRKSTARSLLTMVREMPSQLQSVPEKVHFWGIDVISQGNRRAMVGLGWSWFISQDWTHCTHSKISSSKGEGESLLCRRASLNVNVHTNLLGIR